MKLAKRKAAPIVALILSLTLLITLAACKSEDEDEDEDEVDAPQLSEHVYVADFVPLPRDVGEISNLTYHDGKVYFVGTKYSQPSSQNNYTSVTRTIYSMNPDGTELAGFSVPPPAHKKPADAKERSVIHTMTVDNDGNMWVIQTWEHYTVVDLGDFDAQRDDIDEYLYEYTDHIEGGIEIRKLDMAGIEQLSIDITDIIPGLLGVPDEIAVSPDGEYIYLRRVNYAGTGIRVLNTSGNLLFVDTARSQETRFVRMADGTVAVSDNDGMLYFIDVDTRAFVEFSVSELLSDVIFVSDWRGLKICTGNDEFDVIVSDNKNLYGVQGIRTEEPVYSEVLNWTDSNVSSDYIRDIFVLPDGRVACLSDKSLGAGLKCELILLTKTLRSELPEAVELTLAGININTQILDAVFEFNAKNRDYHITVIDYQQPDDQYGNDYSRLNTEIIAGNVPDILVTDNVPFTDYAAAGLFTDLYPFIDADPGLDRSDFMPSPLKAAETDGKLYRAFESFTILTVVGRASVLGPETGWTPDEFEAVLDANPEADIPFGDILTSSNFLRFGALAAVVDDYIDRETYTANFDSPQFVHFLELAKRLFENGNANGQGDYTDPEEAFREGRQIMQHNAINSLLISTYQWELFGDDLVFKGYPSSSGNGHVFRQFFNCLAITDASPNKDAAWAFVRTILTEEWQLDYDFGGFASNKAVFDQAAKELLENITYNPDYNDMPSTSQAHIDAVIELINSTTKGWDFEEVLLNIIIEEAEDYFNGMKSAEDAARIIQSKASIYLAERAR